MTEEEKHSILVNNRDTYKVKTKLKNVLQNTL